MRRAKSHTLAKPSLRLIAKEAPTLEAEDMGAPRNLRVLPGLSEEGPGEHKQVIILRKDLNMRKGKMVAQGAHASLKALLDRGQYLADGSFRLELDEHVAPWLTGRFKKICVSVNSEEGLLSLYKRAKALALPCALIQDSSLTEFRGMPTYTAVAIGPAAPELIDPLTRELELL